ncbi:MAG: DUF4080 domain-containing protein [Planctomycetaceae bacterium]|nr:DUF4080 domain-containing protein [Planctomycetaceae bacterium]
MRTECLTSRPRIKRTNLRDTTPVTVSTEHPCSIVLATLNARYTHASFGLRYLLANLGELQSQATLMEFTISDHVTEMLAALLAPQPTIVGLGVYIWNVQPISELVAALKRVRPDICVVLGGPELSDPRDLPDVAVLADYVICGEADRAFPDLCRQLLNGLPPAEKVHVAATPTFAELALPYDLYTADDIANRVVYVEASRGCPFTCEFCLSALEIPVRTVDAPTFLSEMQRLIDRGVRQFKFVDRTFNLNLRFSQEILQFFLSRYQPGMFLHFEMIPDRLPEALRTLIAAFPPGALQLEIGVQTFNDETGRLISRRQNNLALEENFRFLRQHTGVHIHADLIVGLPGEDEASFAAGFDRLFRLEPHEIQVGILKRLRGTPITRHDEEWQMIYSAHPPYEILQNRLLSFEQLHRLRRFARHWDLIGNSGNFVSTVRLIAAGGRSPFASLLQLSEWLFQQEGRMHGISLTRLLELTFRYLTEVCGIDSQEAALTLWSDYSATGRRDVPRCLRDFSLPRQSDHQAKDHLQNLPTRQARHMAGGNDAQQR